MLSRFKKQKSGFTLLEILLVIGIIAILAGIVIVAINPSKQLATVRNTQRKSDIKQVANAITQFYIDKSYYPASTTLSTTTLKEICNTGSVSATTTAVTGVTCASLCLINLSELVPTYITAIPNDPGTTTTAGYSVMLVNKQPAISAPLAELGVRVVVGNVPYSCGNPASAACWSTTASARAWGPNPSTTGVSTSTTLLNGKANTTILYGLNPTLYLAAKRCYELTEGGVPVGTWYLPSYAELEAGWAALDSGGFPSGDYWSSTEYSGNPGGYAWGLDTNDSSMSLNGKAYQSSVRCLR